MLLPFNYLFSQSSNGDKITQQNVSVMYNQLQAINQLQTYFQSKKVEEVISYLDSNIVYRYGSNKRFYLDCSAFVKRVFSEVFYYNLPRTSKDQATLGTTDDSLIIFDLVFFGERNVRHVGIFLGNNKFIHCSTRRSVIISSLEETYYKRSFLFAKNIRINTNQASYASN